jgi:hypothetical protein
MVSSGLTGAQQAALLALYDANKASVTAMNAAGVTSASAAESASMQEFQIVETREGAAPLT